MDFAIAIKLGNAASGAPATTGMRCGKDVEKTTNGEETGAIARPPDRRRSQSPEARRPNEPHRDEKRRRY